MHRDERERGGVILPVVAVLVLMLPVIYVLGMVPVDWLWRNDLIGGESCLVTLCAPVITLADNSPAFSSIIDRYLSLFR